MKKLIYLFLILFILTGCQNDNEEMIDPIKDRLKIETIIYDDFIELPETFETYSITWTSQNTDIISDSGQISRVFVDHEIVLVATYIFEDQVLTKTFNVTVKARPYTDEEIVQLDYDAIDIPNIINQDLSLPDYGPNGSRILWTSSKTYVISHQGKYYQPIDDEEVLMTAIIIFGSVQYDKDFEVVASGMTDLQKIEKDWYMLDISVSNLEENILLPKRGYFKSDIIWTSSHPQIINSDGVYIKPIGNYQIILTATIKQGDDEMTKTFDLTVEGYDSAQFSKKLREKLLVNHGIDVIFKDVILPTSILDIADVSWESSHPNVISNTGIFNMPDETTNLELIATITSNEFEDQIIFNYTVYGKNDGNSEVEHQEIVSVDVNTQELFYLDINQDLTLGSFTNLLFKNNRLIIKGQETEGTYISPILHSGDPIDKINLMWGSITDAQATSEFLIRYLSNTGWSQWESHGVWGYGGDNLPPQITKSFPNNVFDIQYQVILRRSTIEIPSPQLTMVSIQFLTDNNKVYNRDDLRQDVLYQVPQLRQADTLDPFLWSNICWATSISMMLNYYNKLTDLDVPQEYYSVLIRQGTERFGTTKNDIGATQFGLTMHELEFYSPDMLLYVLDNYGPVIIGVSKGSSPDGKFGPLTFTSGHIIVVVGYNINDNGDIDIIVNDPAVSWMREMFTGSLEELMLVWDKGGMLLQPDLS